MAWIESHEDLPHHPKLKELCFQLMIKPHEAVGHLHMLWYFTLKYAWRDGDLRRFTPRVICEAAGWEKDHDTFIQALRDTGWIEKDSLKVHDWEHYAGKLLKDRLYNELRRNTPLNDVLHRKTVATVPNRTVPKEKNKDIVDKPRPPAFERPSLESVKAYCQERGGRVDPEKWMNYYESNGWRVGKNPMKDWKAAVRTWEKNGFSNVQAKQEGVPHWSEIPTLKK